MAPLLERLSLKAGARLFSEGEVADVLYLVLSGTVELSTGTGAARRVSAVRRADDLVGDDALAGAVPRSCSAVVLADCDLLAITREQMARRLEEADPVLRFCMAALLKRHAAPVGDLPSRVEAQARSAWGAQGAAARQVLAFEHELTMGLRRGEFAVHFQPIVGLMDRRLAGFEALVRWQHPQRGLLQPDDFIPQAEAGGVISAVTRFCVGEVARAFPALRDAGRHHATADPLFVSINVSGVDLLQHAFAAQTASTLVDGGVEPEEIRLEVTESILMADAQRCADTLQQCRDQGFTIAIDDFGTGYSSLNYLNTLPVSVLKLDRSFTLSLLDGAAGRKIVAAILRLGLDLGLSIIAEGVETEEQATLLRTMGCGYGQGYLFGRPLDAPATRRLIEDWQTRSVRPLSLRAGG